MKSEALLLLALLLFGLCCTEVITTGHGDCFSINGKVYDNSDSTILKGVTLHLTDFQGNFESPIEDKYTYSDSLGLFDVTFCSGYKEVKNGNKTTVYKLDSCKVIFSKNGYENDTITHYQSDTTSITTVNVYMNRTVAQ